MNRKERWNERGKEIENNGGEERKRSTKDGRKERGKEEDRGRKKRKSATLERWKERGKERERMKEERRGRGT